MYERFFGLVDTPFRLTPDPRYLFLSRKHAEALAHLKLGLRESSGFVCITGEVGTGKTTLLRSFLAGLGSDVATAFVFNPPLSALELLETINSELGIPAGGGSRKKLVDALNAHLLAQREAGRRSIVVIDEAQALPIDVLEQLRLLSNLETTTEKLLRIVLVGQPQLRALLMHPELVQLNQRITLRWHMGPLSYPETVAYVAHRLAVASGGTAPPIFTPAAIRRIHRISGGVPRLINLVAHRAMLAAFAAERRQVTARFVRQAYREIGVLPLAASAPRTRRRVGWAAVGVAACVAMIAFGVEWLGWRPEMLLPRSAESVAPGEARLEERRPVEPIPEGPLGPGDPPPSMASGGERSPDEPGPAETAPVAEAPAPEAVAVAKATPPAAEIPGTMEAPRPAADVPPATDVPRPGADVPPSAGAPPPTPDVPPTAEVPAPTVEPPAVAEAPAPTGGAPTAADAAPPAPGQVAVATPPADVAPAPSESPSPPEEATPPVDAGQRLAALDALTTARTAMDAVLAAWHLAPLAADEQAAPATFGTIAQRRGLDHLPLVGNGSMLRLLDLPAILELRIPGAEGPRFVALVGMAERRATLMIEGTRTPVDGGFLDQHWFGEAHVLWRDFESLGPTFGREGRGVTVARLQALLRGIGAYRGDVTGVFDAATESAVLDFQRSRFLVADGRVGRLTRIVLYAAAGGYPRPTLGAPS